ncbi:MAG: tetratricopeptide repeat protein, partial [Pseudonocardiaceae bacterium]
AWQDVDWRALLHFTGGNPLTITVAVRQALRERVASTEEVERFVARVRAGSASLEPADDAALGRDRSLATSLAYGFSHAFTTEERARLAVLHLFRDTVDVRALRVMGDPDIADVDAVPVLAGADQDGLIGLLDRAVDVGLLTRYRVGYFGIHPALPWFFTGLFTDHIGAPGTPTVAMAERAYARTYAAIGDFYTGQVHDGRSAEVLPVLRVEEPNLTYALELVRAHQLPVVGLGCLTALSNLYELTGRNVEWARLVGEVEGDYIDPATDGPLPGREEEYVYVMAFRVRIAQVRRDWPTATRLQTARTAWARDRASPYLELPDGRLDSTARRHIGELATSEHDLGRLLREQDDPACVGHFQAAYDLAKRIGDTVGQAGGASGLGSAYLRVSGLRDLDQAQYWHQRDLDLRSEHDQIGRAGAHVSLANVAYERALDVGVRGGHVDELVAHLNTAHIGYQRALDLLPADHHSYRAVAHHHLGNVKAAVGDIPQALHHLQQAIQHMEAYGNTYGAGLIRYNIASVLYEAGRSGDALHYARAALDNYRDVGPGAATKAQEAEELIHTLEQNIDRGIPDE